MTLILLTSVPAFSDTQVELDELRADIDAVIGTAEAGSVEQCESIALGVKPCGGPSEYLVFSTEMTDSQVLKALVDRYNECDRSRNDRLGLASGCDMVEAPTLVLKGNRCETN